MKHEKYIEWNLCNSFEAEIKIQHMQTNCRYANIPSIILNIYDKRIPNTNIYINVNMDRFFSSFIISLQCNEILSDMIYLKYLPSLSLGCICSFIWCVDYFVYHSLSLYLCVSRSIFHFDKLF